MPSKPAVKFKKVTAENAVIHKKQKIVTAKSVVKSKKWRQKMPSYIKSDGKICRHFTLLGVSADDKYYVSLLYAAEEPEYEIRSVKIAIGLDFSMSELYVDSNGAHADYPHFFRKSQEKLAREQRRLSHCEKGSSRYMKQKKKIARLHAHIARQRKDYLHKESRKITNFYDLVCIESLNMKEMSQDSRFGKSVHDNGWGMFTDFLSYKLERAGKKLVRIDKWYPSSKICSCCGKFKKDLKLEDRMYSCTCGNQMNRDENAAINICREGLRISGVELDTERKIS